MRFDGRKDSPACGRGCVRFDYAPPAPDSPHPALDSPHPALDLMSPALVSMHPALDSPHPALVSMHIDFDFMISAIVYHFTLLIEPAFREF